MQLQKKFSRAYFHNFVMSTGSSLLATVEVSVTVSQLWGEISPIALKLHLLTAAALRQEQL